MHLRVAQEMEDIASSLHPLDYLDAVAWLCAPKVTADSPGADLQFGGLDSDSWIDG